MPVQCLRTVFTCTKNSKAAVRISEALAIEGITVLRFDFTGLGQSEGDFSSTHFSSNVDDLVDAAAFMSARGEPPSLLVGHSLGGTAVLAAAHEIGSAVAVATIGSPANARHVLHLIDEELPAIESEGQATVRLAGRPFNIRKDFVDDARTQSVCENLPGLRKAILVMHSPVDEVVSIDQAALIYTQAKHPKSFVSLDRFKREISVQGELNDEQRKLMLKIAARCPVHRALENEISIASRLI
jgi:pimeloyl-ACP methyl ester carboxylesterase